jgi:2Fe-2S ferredoxin
MPTITFIQFNGEERKVPAEVGQSAMQAGMNSMVPGIVADCGGACSCATCHVYVDPKWESKVTPPVQTEKDMIECALHIQPNSRLSCQIQITPELDGLVLRLPESQF